MLAVIRAIHAELKGAYGSPRMMREVRLLGFTAGKEGGRAADAREWDTRPPQTALPGHHGLETRLASGRQSARPQLHSDGTSSDLDVGHHLPVDRGRLAVPGHRSGSVQPGSDWLVAQAAHDGWPGDRRADDGLVSPTAGAGHSVSYATHADMKAASFEYIEVFYKRKRQHSTLGYRSPIQYFDYWIREQSQERLAA